MYHTADAEIDEGVLVCTKLSKLIHYIKRTPREGDMIAGNYLYQKRAA